MIYYGHTNSPSIPILIFFNPFSLNTSFAISLFSKYLKNLCRSVLVTPALHEMRNQPISTQWTVGTLCGIENTILYVAGSEERGYFMPIPNFGFEKSQTSKDHPYLTTLTVISICNAWKYFHDSIASIDKNSVSWFIICFT